MLNWKKIILPSILAASMVIPSAAYAVEVNNINVEKSPKVIEQKGERKKALTDEQIEMIKTVKEKVKNGEMTKEEAREYLKEQGIPKLDKSKKKFKSERVKLTDEQKELIKEVKQKVQSGEMTKEEAREYLKEQGMPKLDKSKKKLKRERVKLTDEQRESMKEIKEKVQNGEMTREEAKEYIKENILVRTVNDGE